MHIEEKKSNLQSGKRYEIQYGTEFFALIVYTKDIITQQAMEDLTTHLGFAIKNIMDGNSNFLCLPSEYIDRVDVIDKTMQYSMWLLFNNVMEMSGKDVICEYPTDE